MIYTETGEFEEYRFFPRNPDLVLVDSQIVANAPVSLLIAGVGDALATWFEARATAAVELEDHGWRVAHSDRYRTRPSSAGKCCGRTPSRRRCGARTTLVTPAVEKVIEANTLLSGLGFESGGLAAAHAIHNGLTAVGATHGLAARPEGQYRIGDAIGAGRCSDVGYS